MALLADLRKDLKTEDWKQRHSAANLLCKLLAESKVRRDRSSPDPAPPAAAAAAADSSSYVPNDLFTSAAPKGAA